MGLGTNGGGVGVAKFLAKAGANVVVTDLKSADDLKDSIAALKGLSIKFVLGQHRNEDFSRVDMVVKNPDVSYNAKPLQVARENKVPIETDVGIFFELCPAMIVGVTGTRGKSTTAALIYEIIKLFNKDVVLAGNIRVSVLDKLAGLRKSSIAVLELSSWQLEGLESHKKSPRIAVVTNIMADHLNRYKNLEEYTEAKKNIFKFQRKDDILILNYDNEYTRNFYSIAQGQIYFYSNSEKVKEMVEQEENHDDRLKKIRLGARVEEGRIVFGQEAESILSLNEVRLPGEHNIYNMLAAVTATKICGIPSKYIKRAIVHFSGLPGRLQPIKVVNGVEYVNDTTSTTPDALMAAVQSFANKRIILIAGGTDKNLSYKEAAEFLSTTSQVKKIITLPGTATDKMVMELERVRYATKIISVSNMEEAVEEASRLAENGDVVILSPGAASFGLFKNEFDRGEMFNNRVRVLS